MSLPEVDVDLLAGRLLLIRPLLDRPKGDQDQHVPLRGRKGRGSASGVLPRTLWQEGLVGTWGGT